MNNISRFSLITVLLLVGALSLTACGDDTDAAETLTPILVYVTPTPAEATVTSTPPTDSTTNTPETVALAEPTAPSDPTVTSSPTLAPTETPAPTSAPTQTPAQVAAQATSTPAAGGQFGPIVGPDFTPEPLHTALPMAVSARPCPVIINAEQVTLYTEPSTASPARGTAAIRQALDVSEITTDASGSQWAKTAGGWVQLGDQAALDSMRACEILRGNTPNTTLAGLHIISMTGEREVMNLVQLLAARGIPMGTVKGLNGTETLLVKIKEASPQTTTVYRSILTDFGFWDCPEALFTDTLPDPVLTAQEWMAGVLPHWENVSADYFEPINECPAPLDWLAEFSIETMRIANEAGYCLLLFALPGATPPMDQFDQLLPAYEYAAQHPCPNGLMNGIGLHAYSLEDDKLASESDVWVVFRHRLMAQRLDQVLPVAANLPVYITEFGIGGGTIDPGCEAVVRDTIQYTYQLEEDPYIKGFHLWSVGSGAQWYDVTPCLDQLGASLLAYYGK